MKDFSPVISSSTESHGHRLDQNQNVFSFSQSPKPPINDSVLKTESVNDTQTEEVRQELVKSILETNYLKKELEAKETKIAKLNSNIKSLEDIAKNLKNDIIVKNEQLKQRKNNNGELK